MEFWIARSFVGDLCAYTTEPTYNNTIKAWCYDYNNGTLFVLDNRLFPEVTFENSPRKVEIKLI